MPDLGIRKRVPTLLGSVNFDPVYLSQIKCGRWVVKDSITLVTGLGDLVGFNTVSKTISDRK